MKKKLSLFCLLLLFSFSATVFGQGFLDKMAKKASEKIEQKAEDRAEKKMDEKIDEGFDNLEESLENEEDETQAKDKEEKDRKRMDAFMKKVGVSSEPVPIEDQYRFSSKMSMHFKNLDGDGNVKDEGDVVTYLTPGEKNFAYEFISGRPSGIEGPEKGVFIMDYANGATIILSDQDGKKTGVVYGIKFFEEGIEDDDDYVGESEEELDYMNPNYKKTGRTKNIAGYRCEEYVFDTEEEKGSFWVTEKAGWKANDTFSAIFRAGLYSHGVYQGMLMESESADKETGEKSMMQVTELDDNVSVSFIPGDYELTNLGSINFNEEEEPATEE